MPHSSSNSLQPCPDTMSHVGTCSPAMIPSSRTAYGAPDAPVTARTTGGWLIRPSGLVPDAAPDVAWAWVEEAWVARALVRERWNPVPARQLAKDYSATSAIAPSMTTAEMRPFMVKKAASSLE